MWHEVQICISAVLAENLQILIDTTRECKSKQTSSYCKLNDRANPAVSTCDVTQIHCLTVFLTNIVVNNNACKTSKTEKTALINLCKLLDIRLIYGYIV